MNNNITTIDVGKHIGFFKTTTLSLMYQDLPNEADFLTNLILLAYLNNDGTSRLLKIYEQNEPFLLSFKEFTKTVDFKKEIPHMHFNYPSFFSQYNINRNIPLFHDIYEHFCSVHHKKQKQTFFGFGSLTILGIISSFLGVPAMLSFAGVIVSFLLFEIFKSRDSHISLYSDLYQIRSFLTRDVTNEDTLYDKLYRKSMPKEHGEKANSLIQSSLKNHKSQDGVVKSFKTACDLLKKEKTNFFKHNGVILDLLGELTFESINKCEKNIPVLLHYYRKSTKSFSQKTYSDSLWQVYSFFLNELYNHEKYDTCLCILYMIFTNFDLSWHSELKRILVNSSYDITTIFDKVHDKKNLVWILSHVEKKLEEVKQEIQKETNIEMKKIKKYEQTTFNSIKEALLAKISPNTYIEILKQHNVNYFLI